MHALLQALRWRETAGARGRAPADGAQRTTDAQRADLRETLVPAVVVLASIALTLVLYSLGRNVVYMTHRRELMALARTGAALLDPVALGALRPGDEGTDLYRTLQIQLERIRAATPAMRYAYVLAPTAEPTRFRFLVDTDLNAPAAIGEELDASAYPDLVQAVNGPAADHTITEDRWGRWLSGYAPVRDAAGNTVAVFGLDLPASQVHNWMRGVGVTAIAFGASFAVSATVLLRWLTRQVNQNLQDLLQRVRSLSRRVAGASRAEPAAPEAAEELAQCYASLVDMLEASREQMAHVSEQTLLALATAVKVRDLYTGDHSSGVAKLADAVALRLGLADTERSYLRYASLLHDIGKIGIPDRILLKPGPLTPDETAVVREHPRLGYELISQVEALRPVAHIVLTHHERWDGRGYPLGLAGEDIPLSSRIISVVDTFSAMTTDRPYRKARSVQAALAEVQRCAGSQFDPAVAAALADVVRQNARPGPSEVA